MQTFLPYPDFQKSAEVLDKKRCWKQVVEAKQIINVLEGKMEAWKNHPAVKMWKGHEELLKCYYNVFLKFCIIKHNINAKLTSLEFDVDSEKFYVPWWMCNDNFHRAMRARLIEKDRDFYFPKFPNDEGFNGGKYLWPDMNTKTFRII